MDDRFNTIAGWTLFAGVVALGLTAASSRYFEANRPHRPHTMGYAIEGVSDAGEAGEGAVPLPVLLAAADPVKGEGVYAKCKACHTINAGGANGIGPNLYGVLGTPVGKHAAGFAYSADLAGKGGTWDFATMDEWLTAPRKFAPGTKMSFAGLGNPEDRANLLVYLNAQGSNLPLPAAPAAAEAAAADTAGAPAATSGDAAVAAEASTQATVPGESPAAAGAVSAPIPGSESNKPAANRAAGAPSQSPTG